MRLFVAVFPPEELRRRLWEIGENIAGSWKREPPEKLHITVKFIGEVSEKRMLVISEVLRKIKMEPFEVELIGTGAFPSKEKPRVLWVGAKSEELKKLFELVEESLHPLGIPREWREYQPHLTLGRVKGHVDVSRFYTDRFFGSFVVKEFYLVRSYLKSTGSVYEVVERYAFD